MADEAAAGRPYSTRLDAFRHLWAPGRLPWWIALLFAIGSALFAIGGLGGASPSALPAALRNPPVLDQVFFVGSVFFTAAAFLQWQEALNGDVAAAFEEDTRRWHWRGWLPHNLGYLASATQLVGTVLFNLDTADAALAGLSWQSQDLLIWTPNMVGCVCFLIASGLAFMEVSQGLVSFAPRSISWWIAVINLAGSVAFAVSAVYSVAGPTPSSSNAAFWTNAYTLVGAVCFFVGAYLMIPELFDEEASEAWPEPGPDPV